MDTIYFFIGSEPHTITWWQMCCRAVLIFSYALILVRFGSQRIFGKNTSFDIVLSVILGSILSRALTANASFFPTLAASAILILLHFVLTYLSLWSRTLGHIIKGKEIVLVQDGRILNAAMRRAGITRHDLREAMRIKARMTDVSRIQEATLERSGDISFILKSD